MNTSNQTTKNNLVKVLLNRKIKDGILPASLTYTVTDKGVKIGYVLLTSMQDAISFAKMCEQSAK